MVQPLSDDELAQALLSVPAWSVVDGRLTTRRELDTFGAAIGFVQQVAAVAEELDHHPDIDIRWRTVSLTVSTHDSGHAITSRDVLLAQRVEALQPRVRRPPPFAGTALVPADEDGSPLTGQYVTDSPL